MEQPQYQDVLLGIKLPPERVATLLAEGRARAGLQREAARRRRLGLPPLPSDELPKPSETPEQPPSESAASRLLRMGFLPGETPRTFRDYRTAMHKGPAARLQASAMLKAAQEWSAGESRPFLTLMGPAGTGKTHLTQAAVVAANERGVRCVHITAYEFDRRIKDFRRLDEAGEAIITPDEWLDRISQVPMFACDDIGAGYIGRDWTLARFERLFDVRYRLRLPTMATTNLTSVEFRAQCGERVWSRLLDSSLGLVLSGPDMEDQR